MSKEEHFLQAGIVPGLVSVESLPATRLELRWEKTAPDEDGYDTHCHYELVLRLMPYDLRGEVYADDGELTRRERELRRSLGGTKSSGGGSLINREDRTIRTPFRDHSHIRQDAMRLCLPAFVIAEGLAMRLLPATRPAPDSEYPPIEPERD